MIEKIEITQRFNFKRLNRHYECFTVDFLSNSGYYKISERGSGDKFLSESPLCDDSWVDILVDLRNSMTSEIRTFDFKKADQFLHDFERLDLFEDFESEEFLYFEKLELLYSCIVIIYASDGYYEYSFKNNFPKNWVEFGKILNDLNVSSKTVPVALKQEVKEGAAQIICTVDENGPKYYDVEITKVLVSDTRNQRNLTIKITDKNLINKTGGIVQGMSGSPIIQNGMLVGAVTHVFLDDCTEGYGILAEDMIETAEKIAKTEIKKAS
jgi:hypothetical protein